MPKTFDALSGYRSWHAAKNFSDWDLVMRKTFPPIIAYPQAVSHWKESGNRL
jgi:hypothetical protein